MASSLADGDGRARGGSLNTATRLAASGSALAPAYPALLLVAAAAAALARGPRLRPVVAVLLGAAGVGAEVAWRTGLADASAGLSRATVPAGLPVHDVVVAPASWGGDAAALLVVVAAALALILGSRWRRVSARYDAPVEASVEAPVEAPVGERAGPGAPPAGRSQRPGTPAQPSPPQSGTSGPLGRRTEDDWDALSRGEDPTL
ncbi:MAG: Trp biosynthesis-associated membrane protein [Austwickia sp.]|nr:Trp biosynthesis-associated membrane protein [Austwickia sp.]